MKIINIKKFSKMLIICLVLIVNLVLFISNISFSKGEMKEKVVYVTNGDTLWSIAIEEQENNIYYADKEIREIIYEIRKLNNLESDTFLEIGQKLIIKTL